jgi:hypothetical protein
MADNEILTVVPPIVSAMARSGFATWANDEVDHALKSKFDADRIPVAGVRYVRVWGNHAGQRPNLTQGALPDEEIWEVNLVSTSGSIHEVDSRLLIPIED